MRFAGFFHPSILRMPTFREPCFHQGEEQPDTELFLLIIPLLYITLLVGVVEEKKRIVSKDGGKSVSPH